MESAARRDIRIERNHKTIQAPEERQGRIAVRPFVPLLTELGVYGNRFSINLSRRLSMAPVAFQQCHATSSRVNQKTRQDAASTY